MRTASHSESGGKERRDEKTLTLRIERRDEKGKERRDEKGKERKRGKTKREKNEGTKKDPNPKDSSFIRKVTSTNKGIPFYVCSIVFLLGSFC